ncbi:hypothetical protein ACPC54_00280 [Kitasatospora sp. NPDC094028]
MRNLAKTAALALGGIALAVSLPGVANASAATSTATGTTPAPSCVTASVSMFLGTTVRVTNNCSTPQSVQVNWQSTTPWGTCLGVIQPGQTSVTTAIDLTFFKNLTLC